MCTRAGTRVQELGHMYKSRDMCTRAGTRVQELGHVYKSRDTCTRAGKHVQEPGHVYKSQDMGMRVMRHLQWLGCINEARACGQRSGGSLKRGHWAGDMEEVDKAVEAGMHAFPVWGRALHMRTSNLGVHMSRWVSGVKGVHRWRDMTGTKLRERERG